MGSPVKYMRMRVLPEYLSLSSFLTIGPYEEDEGFRELLRNIAQKGLFIYGLLGVILIVFFVSSHLFLVGKSVAWSYVDFDPQADIQILDKILIFLFCLVLVPLSKSSISLTWFRILVSILVWFICIAMLIEDIAGQNTSFTVAYITIALLFAVVMIPYRGWHTALLSAIIIISTSIALAAVPIWMGLPVQELRLGQVIFISIVAFLLTGVSSQLYLNRYEQYQARQEAEELSKKLEERAAILEKLREKSEHQAEELQKNKKLKDQFFANISHEFRTPLTLILGPLKDMLGDGFHNADREKFNLMYRNGEKLLGLINQLLELSKIDAGEIRLQKQKMNVHEFISEVVLPFTPLAESRKIALSCTTIDLPLVAEIDSEMMERAIGNLISNAVKFTEEGEVVVTVSHKSGSINKLLISVKDTGIGIPGKELTNIFDRFYQVTHASHGVRQGTGIGLAFTKEVVELHGGTIRAVSKPGVGSEFILELPLAGTAELPELPKFKSGSDKWLPEADHEAKKHEEAFVEEPKEDAPVVMLIDDNPDILNYLKPHLQGRYRVILHTSSMEALETVKEKEVDLVISDVMMPDPDGFEVCRIIKENPELNHIPVILLTAQAAEESRIEGLELGADDYISKPFSASELMVRVENLIEIRSMLREKFSQQVRIKGKEVEVFSDDARFLQKVQSVIEEHMANSNFGVDWLADEVNLSTRQLQRKIRSVTNLSAGGYIRLLRLERASQLLVQEWGNVSEVAYEVGFRDARYFSRLFKQTFGSTPTEYVASQD